MSHNIIQALKFVLALFLVFLVVRERGRAPYGFGGLLATAAVIAAVEFADRWNRRRARGPDGEPG